MTAVEEWNEREFNDEEDCLAVGNRMRDELLAALAELEEQLEEMVPKSWDGLLTILDDIYPASAFGGVESDWQDETRDIGPRLVTLARHLGAERARADRAEAALREIRALGHNDDCLFCALKDRVVDRYDAEVEP